jgi:1-aminocyclopropane-1-carboxylate deaminase/D-cysteine desulfhydrase-like pyridoxal-dependent ACC family enzyme
VKQVEMNWSRRRFIQGLTLGGAGLGATYFAQSRTLLPTSGDPIGAIRPLPAPKNQSLALAKFFPALSDLDAAHGPLIVNTLTEHASFPGNIRRGAPGNAVFLEPKRRRAIIPWTPLFARQQDILQLPQSVARKIDCADLLVLNESSAQSPIYGNKARKYEFLLPNLQWSGVQSTVTVGAASSNHALQFALANRLADLTGAGQPLNNDLDLVLFDVPETSVDHDRLALLQRLSRRIVVAQNMFGLAGEVAYEITSQQMNGREEAIIPPGGSNELSVLGHMNAIADFARFTELSKAWDAPPDFIFVAMGSGSTVLGLLLGIHLLGWNTKVVGVADQDKPYLSRLVANQTPELPFVEGNVIKLAHRALAWLNEIGFPGAPTAIDQVIRPETFLADSQSWSPGYGLLDPMDVHWREELATAGLKLDPVFTLKAWRSMLRMSEAGALKNKRVLFWNTYNSFDYIGFAQSLGSHAEGARAAL